jgi:hypothetical protein
VTAAGEWERCKPWIVAALGNGPQLETIEDIEAKIEAGKYQFWAGASAAAVTNINDGSKILELLYAGGDIASLVNELLPTLYAFSEIQRLTKVMVIGRKGWERVLKSEGYRHGATVLIKDLTA